TSPLTAVIVEPMGGAVHRLDRDATAFDHRDAAYNLAIIARWTEPGEADRHTAWARELWEALRPNAGGGYVKYLGVDEWAERGAGVGEASGRAEPAGVRAEKPKPAPTTPSRLNQNTPPRN